MPPPHLPPDGYRPLNQTIALFPEAAAGHLWVAYSLDLGPYADDAPPLDPRNAARYVRLMQFGVWSPIFRPHDGGNMDTRVWSFEEPAKGVLTDQLRLRGSLVPYVYTLAWGAHAASFPFVRPMWWDWPRAGDASGLTAARGARQYMFGGVLVRPVAEWQTNGTMVDVWLPEGSWSSWDGTRLYRVASGGGGSGGSGGGGGGSGGSGGGGEVVEYNATLADTPLFVGAGLALPLWPPGRRQAAVPPAARPTVWAVWGPRSASEGSGQHYEDDGETLAYEGDSGGGRRVGSGGGGAASSLTTLKYTWAGDDSSVVSDAQATRAAMVTATTTLRATIRTVGRFDGAPPTKRHALQLRGIAAAAAGQPALQLSNASCGGAALPKLHARRSYDTPGWWQQPAAAAESACPAEAIVVVCPQLDRTEMVEVLVSFVAPAAEMVEAS